MKALLWIITGLLCCKYTIAMELPVFNDASLFVKKYEKEAIYQVWSDNKLVWRAYIHSRACDNSEQIQRLQGIIKLGAKTYADYIVDMQANDEKTKYPVELISDISSFYYYNFIFSYIRGYTLKLKTYIKHYPQIKSDLCANAEVLASAELAPHKIDFGVKLLKEKINEFDFIVQYKIMHLLIKHGHQAFKQVNIAENRLIDAYIYSVLLNDKKTFLNFKSRVTANKYSWKFVEALKRLLDKQDTLFVMKNRWNSLFKIAYKKQLDGYAFGAFSAYSRMEDKFPEIKEELDMHMSEYVVKAFKKEKEAH